MSTIKLNNQPIHKENNSNCNCIDANEMTEMPKVSVVIVSYNQKPFIAKAIEGAVSQKYENLEVVVSDDGSTDGTADVIAEWQSRYPGRIIALLNKSNAGVTRNFNRALQACTGDFITFLGGDDVMLLGKIEAQVRWFMKDSCRVLCGHQIEYIDRDGVPSVNSRQANLEAGAGPENFIRHGVRLPGQSIMVRASCMPKHGFDEAIPIASDLLFWVEVLSQGGEYGYVNDVFVQYRDHAGNVSKRYSEMLADAENTYNIIATRYPAYRAIAEDSMTKHVLYFGGVRYLGLGDKVTAREKLISAIKRKPLFVKAWIRLLQTL
jgi:glycosyltransferase involved in cell wall biosynthesis